MKVLRLLFNYINFKNAFRVGMALILGGMLAVAGEEGFFDMDGILNEPVEGKVLASKTDEGIVTEEIEFTTRVVDGKPERLKGLFVYPEGAKNLPAVFWCMGGLRPADTKFPGVLAAKGYACMVITLPRKARNYTERFDIEDLQKANMTLMARDQMRGITYMSQRPEVDSEKMAVGGPSYGGFFATLLAGVDPRIKAGASFYSGGNHALGTNLPQFTKLRSMEEVEIWNRTIDPAFRHRKRSVPFFWAVSFNDNWFHFPAVIKTYEEAINPENRLVIVPHSRHNFPREINQEIIGFFDTTLTRKRPAYNLPGSLELKRDPDGAASIHFSWSGENRVDKAELIVSYGEVTPWFGWLHRAAFVFPAKIEGARASAQLPIPSLELPLIVWGSITDSEKVMTSTLPLVLTQKELAGLKPDPALELNCFIDGALGPDVIKYYNSNHHPLVGKGDVAEKRTGVQSLRVERPADGGELPTFRMTQFFNVPGLGHELEIWLKADKPGATTVSLLPQRPRNWNFPVVAQLVERDSRLKPLLPLWGTDAEPIRITEPLGTEWQRITLPVPKPVAPVEGYHLEIEVSGEPARYWIDSISMKPIWPKKD